MPTRSLATVAGLLCASLLWTSAPLAQRLDDRTVRPIEGGPIDIAQLTQRSAVVVHGVVAARSAQWIGRVIYTRYDLVVQETLKGPLRNSVIMAVPGGALGNVRLMVPGTPDLQVGEQVVFFGVPLEGDAAFTPLGTVDGIVPIRQGADGAGASVAPRGRPESLNAFLQEVRELGRRP